MSCLGKIQGMRESEETFHVVFVCVGSDKDVHQYSYSVPWLVCRERGSRIMGM